MYSYPNNKRGVLMTSNIKEDDINKYIVIHLKDLKVKNTICKCGYRFYYVGSKVICPRCNRVFTPR